MKNQEQDSQSEKPESSSNSTRMLTPEEGAALCRRMDEFGQRFRAYMRKMEAQKAQQNKTE